MFDVLGSYLPYFSESHNNPYMNSLLNYCSLNRLFDNSNFISSANTGSIAMRTTTQIKYYGATCNA